METDKGHLAGIVKKLNSEQKKNRHKIGTIRVKDGVSMKINTYMVYKWNTDQEVKLE